MTSYLRHIFGVGRSRDDTASAVAAAGDAAPVSAGKPPVLGALRRGDGPRRVAIFMDASRESEFAFKWAAENLVDKRRDRVMLLSVATPPPFSDALAPAADLDVPLETPREREQRMREEGDAAVAFAHKLLQVAREDGAARGVKNIETEVVRGSSASLVGAMVCEAAAARDADVTVLGARGQSVIKSLLSWVGMGSTSEFAARHAAMPVLIVRPKPPDAAAAAAAAATAARAAERIAAAAEAKAAKDAAMMRAAR